MFFDNLFESGKMVFDVFTYVDIDVFLHLLFVLLYSGKALELINSTLILLCFSVEKPIKGTSAGSKKFIYYNFCKIALDSYPRFNSTKGQ
jgi:hypothetical protein